MENKQMCETTNQLYNNQHQWRGSGTSVGETLRDPPGVDQEVGRCQVRVHWHGEIFLRRP